MTEGFKYPSRKRLAAETFFAVRMNDPVFFEAINNVFQFSRREYFLKRLIIQITNAGLAVKIHTAEDNIPIIKNTEMVPHAIAVS